MEQYFDIIEWAYNISVGTAIIPVIVAIFRWKLSNRPLKIATLNAIRGFLISSIGLYLSSTNFSNRLLYHISPCLDIILISILFVAIFDVSKEIKWGLALVCVIFMAFMIHDYLNTKNFIGSYLTSFETVFVIIFLILMLRKVVLTYKSSTYKRSLIWILSALLISNLFSILISTLMESFSAYSTKLMQFSWYISSFLFVIITNLMVAYGFYIIDYKVKDK
jgi:hypothetical protein